MLPPYGSAEVAEALQRRLADAGVEEPHIEVIGDLRTRHWIVSAHWPGAGARATYPFADAKGIHTPAEIAGWLLEELELGG